METPPQTQVTPMSPEQLVDLRRRVLANEPVSDEELKLALQTLALSRMTAGVGKAARTKEPNYTPQGSIADRFAAFKQKKLPA